MTGRAVQQFIFLAALAVASASAAERAENARIDKHPIIAELYADPAHYDGRSVVIYGLVVERLSDRVFMLQDVSQHPLKVIANRQAKAALGDQLIVVGTVHAARRGVYLSALTVKPTKVLGGGGCC